jgi:hypothetical protein
MSGLQLISSLVCVVVEHFYGFQGKVSEIFANQIKFLQNVVRHGNDMAADLFCLENVQ